MTPTGVIRRAVNAAKDRMTAGLARLQMKPNTVTVLGPFFALLACWALGLGRMGWAAFWVILMGACDVLDGRLAKMQGAVTRFGSFLDSTVDRISDALIYLGFMLFFLSLNEMHLLIVTFAALIGSFLTSYARARAELHIPSCTVGFWERPERLVFVIFGLLFSHPAHAVWVLAIMTHVTALHRGVVTWEQLGEKRAFWRSWQGPGAVIARIFFWEYPRYSWQYDVYCFFAIIWVTLGGFFDIL